MSTLNMNKKMLGLLSLIILGSMSGLKAQTKAVDTTRIYLDKLVASKEPADKALLAAKLQKLAAADQEKDVDLAINYYYRLKNVKASDSLVQVELQKFPKGARARGQEASKIYDEKTAVDKENAYKIWIKKFPVSGSGEELIVYDYAVSAIASEYAKEKNAAKAIEYISKLQVDFWKGNGYGGIAETFYKTGDLKNAAVYYKKAMESAKVYYDGKLPDENSSKFAASGYPGLTMTYAGILYEQKKYNEALVYADLAAKNPKTVSPRSNFQYAKILMALNKNQEAYAKLEEAEIGRAHV